MAFSGRFLLNLIQFAGKQGADVNKIFDASGQSEEDLCREEYNIEAEAYSRALDEAIKLSGDNFFGLHAGESLNLTAAGIIAMITQSCATVKEALDYCCEFAMLTCSSLPMTFQAVNGEYKLTMIPEKLWNQQSPGSVRHTIEGSLVFTVKEYHALTRYRKYPLRITLPYQRPGNTSEYERLLGCPILFSSNEVAIYFSKEEVEASVITSDFRILGVLVEQARERLNNVLRQKGYAEIVRESIINLVRPQFPTIDQVASNLNIGVRTLQRKLSEEGLSYKQIMANLRQDFAISYLKNPDLTINEIAYLLSYADASTFIRSFRKMMGQTPKEYRISHTFQ